MQNISLVWNYGSGIELPFWYIMFYTAVENLRNVLQLALKLAHVFETCTLFKLTHGFETWTIFWNNILYFEEKKYLF